MSELRKDWLSGRTVIVAANRALRPNEFATDSPSSLVASADEAASAAGTQSVANLTLAEAGLAKVAGVPTCAFCPGNESKTPPAVYQQLDEQREWRLRVVPNKFPALTLTGEDSATISEHALGAHEVIIESARHVDRTSALSTAELSHVLEAYAARIRHWRDDGRFAYGLIFKNQGPRAGASIAHLHSQLVALPAVPAEVNAELQRAEEDFAQQQACPYCRLIDQERSCGERIVLDSGGYVAFCPFASLQPHEVWLLPASHEPSFEQSLAGGALDRLASILHALIARMESLVPAAAYNMMLRTAPWRVRCDNSCHWRVELLPRVNAFAGLEIATGIYINPLAPESAARQLRLT